MELNVEVGVILTEIRIDHSDAIGIKTVVIERTGARTIEIEMIGTDPHEI